MKIHEIITESMNIALDLQKEIEDDITIANSGQRHPDYLGLDANRATIDAQTFYFSTAQQNQAKAIRMAFKKQGFNIRDKDKKSEPNKSQARKAYELEPTTDLPTRSRVAQAGNQNAFKGGPAPKNTGVLGTPQGFKQGIAHGAAKYKDADNTTGISRLRKSKYNK